jgi:hypothetical protein
MEEAIALRRHPRVSAEERAQWISQYRSSQRQNTNGNSGRLEQGSGSGHSPRGIPSLGMREKIKVRYVPSGVKQEIRLQEIAH